MSSLILVWNGKRNTHGYPLVRLNIMRVEEFDLVFRHIQSLFVLKNHRTSSWFLKMHRFSVNFNLSGRESPTPVSDCYFKKPDLYSSIS
jgi:hypothetical protein